MSAIFLSHSSADNSVADVLRAALTQQGHRSVFLDFDPEQGIPAGRDWEKELYAQLSACRAVIVLCSGHSMVSPWCFAEITHARALGKALFPLKVGSCDIHPLLRSVQVIDLTAGMEDGLGRLARGLKAAGLDPADSFDWDGSRPPYPGLLAFGEKDSAVFFGRDKEIRETLDTLSRQQRFGGARFIFLLGASGSGKSSLLRAGVIPRLGRNPDRWILIPPFRPLDRPLDSLATALAAAFQQAGKTVDLRDLCERLGGAEAGAALAEVSAELRLAVNRLDATVLICLDQLEELFTLSSPEDRDHMLAALRGATERAGSPVLVVATLRSDFLGAVQTQPVLRDTSFAELLVNPMPLPAIAEIIEGPAAVAFLVLEPGLTQALVQDTEAEDALPLLAFTLRELWERRAGNRLTLAEYHDQLGGMTGSVARAAEGVLQGMVVNEKELRRAFLSLVRVNDEGQFARRPANWADLPESVHPVLERFVQARLLVTRQHDAARILEVAHEALFRSWEQLRTWLQEDREFLFWRERLRGLLAEWQRNAGDKGALLRGAHLTEARKWIEQRRDQLSTEEQGFIDFSAKEQARQYRRTMVKVAAVGLIILALGGLGWREAYQATQQRKIAEERGRIGQSLQLAAQTPDQLRGHGLDLALLLGVEAIRAANTPEARRSLFTSLQDHPQLLVYLQAPEAVLTSVAISPDGTRLLGGTGDGALVLWDTAARRQLAIVRAAADHSIASVAFPTAGHAVAAVTDGQAISLWTIVDTLTLIAPLRPSDGDEISKLAFAPDGSTLASAGKRAVTLWDVATKTMLEPILPNENGEVYSLAFSPDGNTLAVGHDKTIVVWDVVNRRRIAPPLGGHPLTVNDVAFSPDGKALASVSSSQVFLWDVATHNQLGEPQQDIENSLVARTVRFIANGTKLVSAGDGGAITVWDVFEQRIKPSPASTIVAKEGIMQIATAPGGRMVAVNSGSRVALWDLAGGRSLGHSLGGYENVVQVASMAWGGEGRTLALGGQNGASVLWDVVDNKQVGSLLAHPDDTATSIALSADQRILAVGTCAAHEVSAVERHQGKFCSQGKILLWRLAPTPLTPMTPLVGHDDVVRKLALSPDGKTVASSSGRSIMLWSLATGRPLGEPVTSERAVLALAFGAAGDELVVHYNDGSALRGSVTSNGLRGAPMIGPDLSWSKFSADVVPRAASGDGLTVAVENIRTAGIRLWDMTTGREVGPELSGHQESISGAAFTADGRMLASVDSRNQVLLWDLDRGSWTQRACAIAGRNMRWEEWDQYLPGEAYHKTCDRFPVPYSVMKGVLRKARWASAGGDAKAPTSAFSDVMRWAEEIGDASLFNTLCWEESVAGSAKLVMASCARAVALAPARGDFRDSRGLARALTGNYQGAIEDFGFFAKWDKEGKGAEWAERWKQRESWIARLRKGENPFDAKTLQELSR